MVVREDRQSGGSSIEPGFGEVGITSTGQEQQQDSGEDEGAKIHINMEALLDNLVTATLTGVASAYATREVLRD